MSTSPEPYHPELDALAQHLSHMTLAPPAVSRDQLFFRAGQAHAQARRRRRFALSAALLTCVSLGAGAVMGRWTGSGPAVVEKLVFVQPAPAPQKPQPEPDRPVPPKVEKVVPTQPGPANNEEPNDKSLADTLRWHAQAGEIEALLSASDTLPPMPPVLPDDESVEDILGLPAGSLSDMERSGGRWR